MKFLIISGNPKKDGLCHSVMEEVMRGAADGGAEVQVLTFEKLGRCRACGGGWGTCLNEHRCAFGDDGFSDAQEALRATDLICIITPVYFADTTELLKGFLDRFRRCESAPNSTVSGKPTLLIASPGGSGEGMINCLKQMEEFCVAVNVAVFDCIGVNRWNNDYKRKAAYAAAKAMAEGRSPGDTICD